MNFQFMEANEIPAAELRKYGGQTSFASRGSEGCFNYLSLAIVKDFSLKTSNSLYKVFTVGMLKTSGPCFACLFYF